MSDSSGLLKLDLKSGDVVDQKADVYVTTVYRNKDFQVGPLAKRVYENLGRDTLQQNLNDATSLQTELNHGQVVMIRSGGSPFQYVIAVCLHSWRNGKADGLQKAIKEVLEMADRNGFTSMALPALGMGGLKYPPFTVAMAILSAIFVFKRDNPFTRLSTIIIPLLDKDTNSIRTFLQTTVAFIDGHRMTCADETSNLFDLKRGLRGLENTKPSSAGRRATCGFGSMMVGDAMGATCLTRAIGVVLELTSAVGCRSTRYLQLVFAISAMRKKAPPEENPKQDQAPPLYGFSGETDSLKYGVGTSFSLRKRTAGITINLGCNFRKYLPGWVDWLLPE